MVRKTLVIVVAAMLLLGGCGRNVNPVSSAGPPPIARPLEVYQQLGFIAGPAEFPVIAGFSTLAGPADSSFVMIAMSMPNSALRFQRDARGFIGEYHVAISFIRDSVTVARVERQENVRIGSFAEAARTDESIIFQDAIALPPGRYTVLLHANDAFSSRGFRARDSLDVPAYGNARRLATPMLVYEAVGRNTRSVRPDLIVNPRRTVQYGTDTPRVYIELYDVETPDSVAVRVLDDQGTTVWAGTARIPPAPDAVRHVVLDIPVGALPLGRLWLAANTGSQPQEIVRTPLLITISDQWMVANFEEVLRFLEYIAMPAELDSLRNANPAQRRERWESFWLRRDPLPATPINEYREEFFQRVRFATDHFGESGKAGWDTDRGEVYIVLGPPTQSLDHHVGRDVGAQPNALEWLYENTPGGRLILTFVDRSGFGRYELTPQSEHAFRTTAFRLRPRQ